MQSLSTCPVCGSEKLILFLSCVDYTVSKEMFQIFKCENCSFKFTNPRPAANEIGKYYQSQDYISHSNSKKGILNKLYQSIRKITISQKLNIIKKYVSRGTLLDVGCGTGEFLNFCKTQGWHTSGIEPDNNARIYAKETYGLTIHDEDFIKIIPAKSFDVISLWHVLEHVYNLNDRIVDLKQIVKDSGLIIIAVPNNTSLDANYYKEYWAAYDLPRHLYHFTQQTLTQLFEKHGLKLIKTLPMRFDSFYVSMLSEKYKTGKINYGKAILKGLSSNLNAALKKENNYSSLIYIFQK